MHGTAAREAAGELTSLGGSDTFGEVGGVWVCVVTSVLGGPLSALSA